MVTKKRLHRISLPNFNQSSNPTSNASPSVSQAESQLSESSFSGSAQFQPGPSFDRSADRSATAPPNQTNQSFQVLPSALRRSPHPATSLATPHLPTYETVGSSPSPSPQPVRTARPQGERNPAIAMLKDTLQPSAPELPMFREVLEPQVHPRPASPATPEPLHPQPTPGSSTPHPEPPVVASPPKKPRRRSRLSLLRRLWRRQRPTVKPPQAVKVKAPVKPKSPQKPPRPEPIEPPPLTPEQRQARIQAQLLERRQRQARSRLWSMTWVFGILVLGSMGGIAYSLLTQLPPATNCQGLSPLASDGERLYCAQQAARSGELDDLVDGIELIQHWKPSHPMYRKAQVSMNEWSAALLTQANTALQEQGLEPAVDIASHIPPDSPLYEEAQDRIRTWEQEWQRGVDFYDRAMAALAEQAWGVATDQVKAMGQLNLPYWQQQRSDELSLRILQEQEAYTVLQDAEDLVGENPDENPEQLAQALAALQDVPTDTLVWEQAEDLAQQWGEALIAASLEALEAGNLDRAIALVQALPLEQVNNPVALDLIRLSQAQHLADLDASHWRTNPVGIWRLIEAIAAADDISPESRFYGDAQAAIAQWQKELEDLSQLQVAQWIASFENRYAFSLATTQAETIEPGRPRRVQAQTLIAHWRQESQRIVDRPILAQAVAKAEVGTLEALQAAIAQAQTISPERAIYPQVEIAINQWSQRVQAIEDGPVLKAARQLAAEGQWQEAIAKAETIGSERALHEIAQRDISNWRGELQLERDRQWLAEARTLAGRRRLTNAIQVASQIQPRQPLYREAQAAIGQWIEERDEIQERQASQPQATESSPPAASPQPSPPANSSAVPSGNYEGYFDSRYYDDP